MGRIRIPLVECSLLALAVSAYAQPQPGSPWPMMHHDQYHTGRSPHNGPETAAVKWVFPVGTFLQSSPVISSDGTIYIVEHDLCAVNPDGTEKWRFPLQRASSSTPAIGFDGTIYLQTYSSFLAVNPDGTLKWEDVSAGGVTLGPVIGSDGTVYVACTWPLQLFAFDPDGTLKWVIGFTYYLRGAPAVGPDGTIYINGHNWGLGAVNPHGTLKWELPRFFYGGISFSVQDNLLYAGVIHDTLKAITPGGTIEWEFCAPNSVVCTPSIGEDGTIYFGTYYWAVGSENDSFCAVYPDGTLKWAFPAGASVISSAAVDSDGTIFFCTQRPFYPGKHNVYALNPDGTLLWGYSLPDGIVSSPAIGTDGTLYVGCLDGSLYAIGEATGVEESDRPPTFRNELRQNRPNPFVASGKLTSIQYGLANPGYASLKVYDAAGRLVRTLVARETEAGEYSTTWDGKDSRDDSVPGGVYFYKLQAGSFADVKKMVLFR